MNIQTGEIRRWESLTTEQQQSGEWIKLPSHDENGAPLAQLNPNYVYTELFGKAQSLSSAIDRLSSPRRFDALGKAVS